jgi:hypothetical protein
MYEFLGRDKMHLSTNLEFQMKFNTNHEDRSSLYGFMHNGTLITGCSIKGMVSVMTHSATNAGGFFKVSHPALAVFAEMDKFSREFHDWVEDTEDLEYDEVRIRGAKLDKQLHAMSRKIPKEAIAELKALLKVKTTAAQMLESHSKYMDEVIAAH